MTRPNILEEMPPRYSAMVSAAMENRTDNSTPREMRAVIQAEISAANLLEQQIVAADIVHQIVTETLAEMLDEMNEETTR